MSAEEDRLSSLPDDLIHKILSFIGIKHAVETSVLSSRWRFLWTSIPYLDFSSEGNLKLPNFSEFVTHFLSCRNNQEQVSSVKLHIDVTVNQAIVKRILNYAFSHDVQELTVVTSWPEDPTVVTSLFKYRIELPLSLFSSPFLKHLTLTDPRGYVTKLTSAWELPAVTTLHLNYITLEDENTDNGSSLFSKCTNLKNLTLDHCTLWGYRNIFNICHPRLSNLTLEYSDCRVKIVNVVAPQLKNLTVISSSGEVLISAPDLAYLLFKGFCRLQISADSFRSLEKLDFCICDPNEQDAYKLVGMLRNVCSVKFLTLNSELVKFLSSISVNLITHQPSPFVNLKSLIIYPALPDEPAQEVTMSSGVKMFLLDGSPTATLTTASHEEIRVSRINKLALVLLEQLKALLDKEKAFRAYRRRVMMELGSQKAKMHKNKRARFGKSKACDIISNVKLIKEILAELPTSRRAKLQPCFASLHAQSKLILS